MKPTIHVENLSKLYRIGLRQDLQYRTLRDTIAETVTGPWNRLRERWRAASPGEGPTGVDSEGTDYIWGLKDISFDIRRGDVVGVIGRNGAGKSTLLKILSRITEPTTGRVELRGRVASLLEVGTGFHPELTGRENVYLNGSILGMTRKEIAQKFEEIVAFAEIERFLDTPVKRYSSGMYVRLAFAVAAHLDPEILLVDEVLAVGDVEFQKKCLSKMQEVVDSGRTVFFVSHNLQAITRLCTRGLLLERGRLVCSGGVDEAVARYQRQMMPTELGMREGSIVLRARFLDATGTAVASWHQDTDLVVEVKVTTAEPIYEPVVDLAFYTNTGARVFSVQSDHLSDQGHRQFGSDLTYRFVLRNIGFTCDYLSVDIGVRSRRETGYLVCWKKAEVIPVSLKGVLPGFAPGTIVHVPCQVTVGGDGA